MIAYKPKHRQQYSGADIACLSSEGQRLKNRGAIFHEEDWSIGIDIGYESGILVTCQRCNVFYQITDET